MKSFSCTGRPVLREVTYNFTNRSSSKASEQHKSDSLSKRECRSQSCSEKKLVKNVVNKKRVIYNDTPSYFTLDMMLGHYQCIDESDKTMDKVLSKLIGPVIIGLTRTVFIRAETLWDGRKISQKSGSELIRGRIYVDAAWEIFNQMNHSNNTCSVSASICQVNSETEAVRDLLSEGSEFLDDSKVIQKSCAYE